MFSNLSRTTKCFMYVSHVSNIHVHDRSSGHRNEIEGVVSHARACVFIVHVYHQCEGISDHWAYYMISTRGNHISHAKTQSHIFYTFKVLWCDTRTKWWRSDRVASVLSSLLCWPCTSLRCTLLFFWVPSEKKSGSAEDSWKTQSINISQANCTDRVNVL